jgi:hypothetical protein
VPLKHGQHFHVASCRTAVLGCTETPLSSSRPTAAFTPQLLLPTCHAISASPPSLGLRELTVRGSSELTASGHHLHTSSLCTSSPCMIILLPPVVRPALTSALPRRRSLRDRPCQGTAVLDLVALRVGLSQSATPHFRPRASLARIALLLMRLKPLCTSLLAPGRSPPLEFCSCTHTPTPPASMPCLLRPPNTCTHCKLLRVTTRTLAPPARHRSRSALAPLARARRAHTHPHRARRPPPVLRRSRAAPTPYVLAHQLSSHCSLGCSCSAALTPAAARPDASYARSASAFAAPPVVRGPRWPSPPVRRTWCLCHSRAWAAPLAHWPSHGCIPLRGPPLACSLTAAHPPAPCLGRPARASACRARTFLRPPPARAPARPQASAPHAPAPEPPAPAEPSRRPAPPARACARVGPPRMRCRLETLACCCSSPRAPFCRSPERSSPALPAWGRPAPEPRPRRAPAPVSWRGERGRGVDRDWDGAASEQKKEGNAREG